LVEVTTLDYWAQEQGIRPNLLKLDVEGHELSVLEGAYSMLRSVEVVQFEFGGCNIDSRTFFQDYYYLLKDQGFCIFRLGPRGLIPVKRYSEVDEAFTTTNYLALRGSGIASKSL
jgi:methyltransferase, FkbM family